MPCSAPRLMHWLLKRRDATPTTPNSTAPTARVFLLQYATLGPSLGQLQICHRCWWMVRARACAFPLNVSQAHTTQKHSPSLTVRPRVGEALGLKGLRVRALSLDSRQGTHGCSRSRNAEPNSCRPPKPTGSSDITHSSKLRQSGRLTSWALKACFLTRGPLTCLTTQEWRSYFGSLAAFPAPATSWTWPPRLSEASSASLEALGTSGSQQDLLKPLRFYHDAFRSKARDTRGMRSYKR